MSLTPEQIAKQLEATADKYRDTMGLTREGAIRRIHVMVDDLYDAAAVIERALAEARVLGYQSAIRAAISLVKQFRHDEALIQMLRHLEKSTTKEPTHES